MNILLLFFSNERYGRGHLDSGPRMKPRLHLFKIFSEETTSGSLFNHPKKCKKIVSNVALVQGLTVYRRRNVNVNE